LKRTGGSSLALALSNWERREKRKCNTRRSGSFQRIRKEGTWGKKRKQGDKGLKLEQKKKRVAQGGGGTDWKGLASSNIKGSITGGKGAEKPYAATKGRTEKRAFLRRGALSWLGKGVRGSGCNSQKGKDQWTGGRFCRDVSGKNLSLQPG